MECESWIVISFVLVQYLDRQEVSSLSGKELHQISTNHLKCVPHPLTSVSEYDECPLQLLGHLLGSSFSVFYF